MVLYTLIYPRGGSMDAHEEREGGRYRGKEVNGKEKNKKELYKRNKSEKEK